MSNHNIFPQKKNSSECLKNPLKHGWWKNDINFNYFVKMKMSCLSVFFSVFVSTVSIFFIDRSMNGYVPLTKLFCSLETENHLLKSNKNENKIRNNIKF